MEQATCAALDMVLPMKAIKCTGYQTQQMILTETVGDSLYLLGLPFNPLTTDDAFWHRQILAARYQLAQSVLK